MLNRDRRRRRLVLETLEQRAKQFRSREDSWPFRMPHEPLDLDALIETALAREEDASIRPDVLRGRHVLRMEWSAGGIWDLWVVTLPSGLHVYGDSDDRETRVLASARRGNPGDADGFFLERLAESHGHIFGIEMGGDPPDRIKTSIGDRDFLADVFVELLEGTPAERALIGRATGGQSVADFRQVVAGWLAGVLSAPAMARRQPRVREQDPSLPAG